MRKDWFQLQIFNIPLQLLFFLIFHNYINCLARISFLFYIYETESHKARILCFSSEVKQNVDKSCQFNIHNLSAKAENVPSDMQYQRRFGSSCAFAFCIAKYSKFLQADNKDSDKTAPMHRLIGVFAGHTSWSESTFSQGLAHLHIDVYRSPSNLQTTQALISLCIHTVWSRH